MSHKRSGRLTLRGWFAALLRQPPQGFYRRPAIYLSGNRMEIEHFRRILFYDENRICLQLAHGRFTVQGDALRIGTLTETRITLYGTILRTDFTDD